MKIAIIGSRGYPYVYSGYETFVKELSERLVRKGIDTTIYCHKNLFKKRPEKINNINLVYIAGFKSKYLSQFFHSFFSFVHCIFNKPDLILAVNVANGPFGIISKIFKIPTLINVDGLEWKRPKWKGLGSLYFKLAAKTATIFFDIIINDSEEMRKIYLNQFKIDSKVISYGSPEITNHNNQLSNFGLNELEYFLVVGRLIPDNNVDLIIDGFLKSNTNKKLVIVGDVPYNDRFSKKIKKISNERIFMTGYINDPNVLYELYVKSYAYIHGHEFGGTNPTMIKALAYGTAILALDTPFNNEMLQKEKFGFYFSKDSNSIKSLIELMDNDISRIKFMKQNSHKGITKKYDWDCITESYIKVFNSLLFDKKRKS